jgi:GTPase SAR1 family protein
MVQIRGKDMMSLEHAHSANQILQAKQTYFKYLAEQCGYITLNDQPTNQVIASRRFKLENLFVPVFLHPNESQDVPATETNQTLIQNPRQPVGEVLSAYSRLVILGAAGSGKTTLIKRLAIAYAFPEKNDLFADNLPARPWLPFLIQCHQLGEMVKWPIPEMMTAVLQMAGPNELGDAFKVLVNRALSDGNALLLIDGVDEIADKNAGFVNQLVSFLTHSPHISVVVTAQRADDALKSHCRQYKMADFDNDDITRLTLAWHQAIVGQKLPSSANTTATQKHIPVIKIKAIELENIGLFERLKLEFDPKCAVLIGLNGSGKTTILRALALSLIGVQEGIHENTAESLLRITGRKENHGNWAVEGNIRLCLEIDGERYHNEIHIKPVWQTGDIQIQQGVPCHALFTEKGYLKSLIIGFSQQRRTVTQRQTPAIAIAPPNVNDLLALINNDEDRTFHSFVSWIANLDIDIKNGDVKKRRLLEKAFELFSEIVGEEVRFDAVTNVEPLELWVKTKDSPDGIPIRLASLGYQSIMGWIGHFLERIYAVSGEIDHFYEVPTIVMVDEIDLFLHPCWQSRILKVLRKNFPHTQFIVTTHSPLVVDGLAFKQVTQLYYEQNRIVAIHTEGTELHRVTQS